MKFDLLLSQGIVTVFALSCGRAKPSPEEAFWKWLQNKGHSLFDFEKDQERTFFFFCFATIRRSILSVWREDEWPRCG